MHAFSSPNTLQKVEHIRYDDVGFLPTALAIDTKVEDTLAGGAPASSSADHSTSLSRCSEIEIWFL